MRRTLFLLTFTLSMAAVAADEQPPQRDFGFRPLEIYDFKPGTSQLSIADLNGDGRDDVIFANNHASRLEILLRKAESEDSSNDGELPQLDKQFEDKGFIVDQSLKVVRVHDMNGDGRLDLVTFGHALGILIRYQQADGSFGAAKRIFLKNPSEVVTLKVDDLNDDQHNDLLVSYRDRAEIYWNHTERPFLEHKTIPFSDNKSLYAELADVNNDGKTDLLFHFNSAQSPLRVHLNLGSGHFGIEQPVYLPPIKYLEHISSEHAPAQIGTVLRNRMAFRLYGFEEVEQSPLLESLEVTPGRIGLEGASRKDPAPWICRDFNSDQNDDLLIAAPELSQLHLYLSDQNGINPEPQRIGSLSKITHLSQLANGDLLVISQAEKTAAIHAATHLEQFPSILPIPGEILAGSTLAGSDLCWFTVKNSDKKHELIRFNAADQTQKRYPLDLKNGPDDMMVFQLSDEQVAILLFIPYDKPKMFILEGGDQLTEITSDQFRALAHRITRYNIGLDAPGDGSGLVVAQGAIARRFEWTGEQFDVAQQYNSENEQGDVVASCPYTLQDGQQGLFMYDRHSNDLIYFADQSSEWGKIHVPDASSTTYSIVQLKHTKRDILALLDRNGISQIRSNGTRLSTRMVAEYLSPQENPMIAYWRSVKLASPPRPMAALIDPVNRTVELMSYNEDKLKQEIRFEVFLESDFAQPMEGVGAEPHEIDSGDLNGDNIGDLIILCQDKLLIYLGE